MQSIKKILAYLNSFSWPYKVGAVVVFVVIIFLLVHLTKGSAAPADTAVQTTRVTLASVASLSNQGGPLPVTGKVTSVSQASLTALSSGQITGLPHKLGDRVAAGTVIASFENSSQRAAVLQAQGSYDAAVAAQTAVSPADAASAARNAFKSAYSTLDSTLHSQIDTFFGASNAYGPTLLITAPMYSYGELPQERVALDDEMAQYRAALPGADSADPAALLTRAVSVTADVSTFITRLAVAAQDRNSQATSAQLSALDSARTAISALAATLASAQQSYRSSSVTTTSSTDASITIALGGLRAAQANLEKTYTRASISGTIVSLPVHLGDFVSQGAAVAVISNPGALQVESYVTPDDAKTLSVGGKATIDTATAGTIVFIAPALDPITGKIQVKVALNGSQSALSDGSTVSVSLDRAGDAKAASNAITIPIAAAKITPQGPVVFTVASSSLVAHAVVFGAIEGGQVAVTSGLTLDMDIVTDARGLSEGQVVMVDSQ